MSLPKLEKKWFTANIRSTGKEIQFRPFTVGEQKQIMLIKNQSHLQNGDDPEGLVEKTEEDIEKDAYFAIMQMIQGCVKGISIEQLSPADFEALFYDIRSVSDGDILFIKMDCQHCKHENEIEFNTRTDLEMINRENFSVEIEIKESNNSMKVEFRQPTMGVANRIEKKKYGSEEEKIFDTLAFCLRRIMTADEIFEKFTHGEAVEFLDNLPDHYFKKLDEFFGKSPEIVLNKGFSCKNEECGKNLIEKGASAKSFLY